MQEVQLQLNNVRTYFLVAAIANGVIFLAGTVTVILAGLGTLGCGCLLGILPLINLTVMIFDFMAFSRISQEPTAKLYSFLKMCSIFDMVAGFALVPLIMGILSIQILGRPEVYAYFHREEAPAS
jgi:hypothetical protein